MSGRNEKVAKQISAELKSRFPDMNPKIAEIRDSCIIYELEKHANFTYYSVTYTVHPSGEVVADWDNAELTVY